MVAGTANRTNIFTFCCCLFAFSLLGCSNDNTPVQTTPESIDAYLEANPDEAYTSDSMVEEMTQDTGEGEPEVSDEEL